MTWANFAQEVINERTLDLLEHLVGAINFAVEVDCILVDIATVHIAHILNELALELLC